MVVKMKLCFLMLMLFHLSIVVLAQDSQPQEMPEPTKIFTCGENYQPVDLAFDGEGNLYSTDAQLLSWFSDYARAAGYTFNDKPNRWDVDVKSYVYNHISDTKCDVVTETSWGIYGLTSTLDKQVCYIAGDGNEWIGVTGTVIECDERGFWVLVQSPTPGPSAIYTDLVQVADAEVMKKIPLIDASRFITVSADGTLWITTYSLMAPTFVGGILKVSPEGLSEYFDSSYTFQFTTGIFVKDEKVIVADFALGQLVISNFDGATLAIFDGLQGPMGMTQAPNGDLCIAEMRGGRISCYSLASLGIE